MEVILFVIALVCYLCGTVGYIVYLFRDWPVIHRICWGVLLVGALAHAGSILVRSMATGHLAVTTSHEALSFFAFLLVATYLIVQVRLQTRILGSFVSPLAVLFMFMSSIIPETGMGRAGVLQSGWVVFHVSTLFLANVMFALACMAGVMYLLQERQIKRKSFGYLFSRLPPLQRLDKINYHCLLVGFPLMTIGLVTGFGYASLIWRKTWSGDPKEILSLVTWLIYAILVHERLTVGWRGRRSAWLSIVGFAAVLVTFLGVNLFLQGHHTAFTR